MLSGIAVNPEEMGFTYNTSGTCIDIGGIGLYTFAFFMRVIALEANPITFKLSAAGGAYSPSGDDSSGRRSRRVRSRSPLRS
jgi:hypothetical protein